MAIHDTYHDTQEYLRQFQAPYKAAFQERLQSLPAVLPPLIQQIHKRDYRHWRERDKLENALFEQLKELEQQDPEIWSKLCAVFFPKLDKWVLKVLEDIFPRQPYTSGYHRRAFRYNPADGKNHIAPEKKWEYIQTLWSETREYEEQDLAWFAVHAGLLYERPFGWLFAAALDAEHTEVWQILQDTAASQHEVARMGHHVTTALLASERPEAWELSEKLLLAAQRQEGLRQVILESVDECHPEAFPRFLRLILEEDMLRFASTSRAACVWFGLDYDVSAKKTVHKLLEQALEFLEHPEKAKATLQHKNQDADGVAYYLALYTLGMCDVRTATAEAKRIWQERTEYDTEAVKAFTSADSAKYMAAIQFLIAADEFPSTLHDSLLADPDLRFGALVALERGDWDAENQMYRYSKSFESLRDYVERLPKQNGGQNGRKSGDFAETYEPLLFPWIGLIPTRSSILDHLPSTLTERSLMPIEPYLSEMSSDGKRSVLHMLRRRAKTSAETQTAQTPPSSQLLQPAERTLLLSLLQDRVSSISQEALEVVDLLTPTPEERQTALTLLKRKSNDLRRGLIRLLAKDPQKALQEAQTLLETKNTAQRQAGLQLLLTLQDAGTSNTSSNTTSNTASSTASNTAEFDQTLTETLEEVCQHCRQHFAPKNASESTLYERLTQPANSPNLLSLNNGLGLFDPQQLTQAPPVQAQAHDYPKHIQRGATLLRQLDALIDVHKETPLYCKSWDDSVTTVLLGNLEDSYDSLSSHREQAEQFQQTPEISEDQQDTAQAQDEYDIKTFPLAKIWLDWWNTREDAQATDLVCMSWAQEHRKNQDDHTLDELDEPDDELDELETLNELLAELDIEAFGDASNTPNTSDASEESEESDNTKQIRQSKTDILGPVIALKLKYARIIRNVFNFLQRQSVTLEDQGLYQDLWETMLAHIPRDAKVPDRADEYYYSPHDPRELMNPSMYSIRQVNADHTEHEAQIKRSWFLHLYENTAFEHLDRRRMGAGMLILGHERGWANVHDFFDELIGPRSKQERRYSKSFDALSTYTRRKLREDKPTSPVWLQAVSDARDRVLEVELQRGDLETPATLLALSLQSIYGLHNVLRLLAGMGKNPLRRGYAYSSLSKDATFSRLLRVSYPTAEDTPELLRTQAAELGVTDQRLLDLAMFAPQWAPLIAQTLDWGGLGSAVFWLHAHTKDDNWSVPTEVREEWEAQISERTPLSADKLTNGAVDVAWFRQMYAELGDERFQTLLSAAKYASSSGGHKRAELFALALLGQLNEDELLARINDKRHKDAVRALGLLPLPDASVPDAARAETLKQRYLTLSTFRKEARHFGAQRQASERLAADIGLTNLAHGAGYADPQRLMWAMEARMTPDWSRVFEQDDLRVCIEMSDEGDANLVIQRGQKTLKNLPAALKKHPEAVHLRETVKELKATKSRMRSALEEAMTRGDHFSAQELSDLAQHPVIAPMLSRLVWVLNENTLGWWQNDGVLRHSNGTTDIADQALRIAHPHDLFVSGLWPKFQEHVMTQQIQQPFKQVFREYYPLSQSEQNAHRSVRYQGHFVQPSQALALLKSRGWIAVYDEGIRKTDHAEGINMWIDSDLVYGTPSEVEGLPINGVYFTAVGQWEALPLKDIPPRLFSEVMRDLDLVVSVAHVGGVDPEASQSTVEMRQTLLEETVRLLKFKNVRIENTHALIAGEYANYTVHLGSGVVHRQPGGFVCIIPVQNQHQGRIFLPFADPDPRTAEVISKVLLLAEDKKILDPTILEQLR